MTAITVHYRAKPSEQRHFPNLPRQGDYVVSDGLWRVVAVVFGEAVDVFAVPLSASLATETKAEWENWDKIADCAEPATKEQTEMFA